MYTCYIYIEPNRLPQQGPGGGGAGRCRIYLPYLDAKKRPESAQKAPGKASKKRPNKSPKSARKSARKRPEITQKAPR